MTYFVFSSATITGHMYDRFPLALLLFVYLLLQAVKEDGGDRGWVPVRSYSKDKTFILSDCSVPFTILIVVVVHRQDVLI
jgi:hypothetical protein